MSRNEDSAFSIVCLSPQEWATPLPTNRQQIMRRAASRGHVVLFVETGEFLGRHLLRLLRGPSRRSLRRRLVGGEDVAQGITVRKALNVLPWGQRFTLCDRINGRVSRVVLRRASSQLPSPRVTWLYDPRATWAIGRLGDSFGVYDCVDDYAEQASGDRNRALVAIADRRAAAAARLVFATTTALRDRHVATNPSTHLVGNAADFEHFAPAADRRLAAAQVAGLRRPVLGFVGNIIPAKIEIPLLDALARANPARTILLAGPADPSLVDDVRALVECHNAIWIGPVPYDDVPSIVAGFDVALLPYAENAYTRNVFPLKLYEYLAAGKPVVATGLPELSGLEPDVVVAHGVDAVEAAVAAALTRVEREDVERRQKLAAANTWDVRAERLLALIAAEFAA
jgi:glycosyltransferase involved in cell wall biosynthesis